jgi:hypothetical protein
MNSHSNEKKVDGCEVFNLECCWIVFALLSEVCDGYEYFTSVVLVGSLGDVRLPGIISYNR